MRTRLTKIFIINLTVGLAALAISMLFLEAYLRLSGFGLSLTPGNYMSHPTLKYTFRPHASGKTYDKVFKINSLGLRDYEYGYPKDSRTFRILCLGDSVTFGIGLALEDTYPKQLEKILQARFPQLKIEALNCGVPSYNTVYEYLFLKDEGLKYRPDLAIIGYVYNDSIFHEPFTPSKYAIVNKIKDIARKLYSYDFILNKFYQLQGMSRGFATPDPKNRIINLQHAYSDDYFGWQKNKEAFKLLAELSRKNNIPVIYVIFPKFESLEKGYPYMFYHRIVGEALKDEPYVLDLLPYLEGKKTEDLWVTMSDSHPNREANAIIAEAISDFLVSKKLIRR